MGLSKIIKLNLKREEICHKNIKISSKIVLLMKLVITQNL